MGKAAAHFALAGLMVCSLSRVRDPETEKMGWITRCTDTNGVSAYITPNFVKHKKTAIRHAKQWLKARRPAPKWTVSIDELRASK